MYDPPLSQRQDRVDVHPVDVVESGIWARCRSVHPLGMIFRWGESKVLDDVLEPTIS